MITQDQRVNWYPFLAGAALGGVAGAAVGVIFSP